MEEKNIKQTIITKPAFKTAGISILCNDRQSSEYINWDKLWDDFRTKYIMEIKNRINENISYGVAYCGLRDENDLHTMIKYPDYIYIAAVEVNSFDGLPGYMTKKEIPESLYSVFTYSGKNKEECVNNSGELWSYAYGKWLPQSGYIRNEEGIDFEYDDVISNADKYEMNVCIPIEGK